MLVTALLVDACKKANVDDVRRYIREGADVNQRLDSRPNLGWAPIHFACQLESSVILAILLENGADPNLLTNDGFPALNIACNAAECSKEMVQMLLEHGADTNVFDSNGLASLHDACHSRNAAIVAVLLKYGANVNFPTRDDVHPLHIASFKGEEQIIQILLKHGADTNVLDSNGMAPLLHPCDSQNAAAVAALLGHGANVNLPTNGRGTNANLPKMDGSYPLHIACDVGVVHVKETVVRMLLEHGADVDAIWQTDGSTPLHIACLSHHRNHDLGNLVDLLLDQQPNICLLDSSGLCM